MNCGNEIPATLPIGTYVLATKYEDGDPADPWAVGYLLGVIEAAGDTRYLVGQKEGPPYRANGYRKIAPIWAELGNWLIKNASVLEYSPSGAISLWAVFTGAKNVKDEQHERETAAVN